MALSLWSCLPAKYSLIAWPVTVFFLSGKFHDSTTTCRCVAAVISRLQKQRAAVVGGSSCCCALLRAEVLLQDQAAVST
jgi:hypothetical protein